MVWRAPTRPPPTTAMDCTSAILLVFNEIHTPAGTHAKMAAKAELVYSYRGKEYVFLSNDKEQLDELQCSICIELVFEPVLTSCGHIFCQGCLASLSERICPTCRSTPLESMRNRKDERKMKSFKVKCANSTEGCEWEGELGYAEDHVLRECLFAELPCPKGCGRSFKRQELDHHVNDDCKKRPYSCPYCEHGDTYQSITGEHYTNCSNFPLQCPAGCDERVKRSKMENHLTACPEELDVCPYSTIGCEALVKRDELQSHLTDSKEEHLELAMHSQKELTMKYSKLCSILTSPTVTFPLSPRDVDLPFRPWLQNTPTCYPCPPWVFRFEGFEEKKRYDEEWHNGPLHSHFGGYKMCLRVYPNGYDNGRDTHISVYACLMKGDNDDNLKFPFNGHIVVSLLNQLEDKNHDISELWSPEDNVPEATSGRVTTGERSDRGWGYAQYIPHNDLNYNSDKNCQYLKNDCLFFRVDKIECVL